MSVPSTPSGKPTCPSDDLPQQTPEDEHSDTINDTISGRGTDSDSDGRDLSAKFPSSDDAKSQQVRNTGDRYLDVPPTIAFRPSADTLFSDLSLYTGNLPNVRAYGRPTLRSPSPIPPSIEPTVPSTRRSWRTLLWTTWLQSKGMLMVIISQFFGASMNVMTQSLEKDGAHGKGMHPFQILFARMSITAVASYVYMWYNNVSSPFGTKEVRWLLILRSVGGFFGVFGMYYSLLYMPLSEATVLTFLSPIVACYACSFLMPNEPFTRRQQLAGLVSLLGVVLIARPFSGMNGEGTPTADTDTVTGNATMPLNTTKDITSSVDTYHHLIAIGFALIGVLGAACAYTVIRAIGTRAHALVSVTYFSTYTTIVALVGMLAIPSISFRLPGSVIEWVLLVGLGVAGFLMQYLLTAGLAYEPPIGSPGNGSRATSMVYTQMLFALFYDKLVMDSSPSAVSWAGSGLILGSALYVALVRESGTKPVDEELTPGDEETGTRRKDVLDEERGLEEGQGLLDGSERIDFEEGPGN